MDTTRKIPKESILLLDEIELSFRRRGLHVNQKKLIAASVAFAAQHQRDFLGYMQKQKNNKEDNTKEQTEKFLKHAKEFDFGKNWMEDIDICQ
jgi:hypothetical protein